MRPALRLGQVLPSFLIVTHKTPFDENALFYFHPAARAGRPREGRTGLRELLHRWPNDDSGEVWLTTTRENFSSFQKGIPWTTFPKTFQDAIKVTHRFGLQYLWIDKWYGPTRASMGRRLAAQVGIAKPGMLLARIVSRTPVVERRKAGWARVDLGNPQIPGSLSTRGWTFQERIVSRRVVHFTDKGLI